MMTLPQQVAAKHGASPQEKYKKRGPVDADPLQLFFCSICFLDGFLTFVFLIVFVCVCFSCFVEWHHMIFELLKNKKKQRLVTRV